MECSAVCRLVGVTPHQLGSCCQCLRSSPLAGLALAVGGWCGRLSPCRLSSAVEWNAASLAVEPP